MVAIAPSTTAHYPESNYSEDWHYLMLGGVDIHPVNFRPSRQNKFSQLQKLWEYLKSLGHCAHESPVYTWYADTFYVIEHRAMLSTRK